MKTEALAIKKIRGAAKDFSADSRLIVSPPLPAFHERTLRGFTWEVVVRSSSRKVLLEAFSHLESNFHVSLDLPSLL